METESSGVESPESAEFIMNSSLETNSDHFDSEIIPQPRKLTFMNSPECTGHYKNPADEEIMKNSLITSPKKQASISPPYRKVRALRLFDTPATPKTIMQKSSTKFLRLFPENKNTDNEILAKPIEGSITDMKFKLKPLLQRPKPLPLHNRALDNIKEIEQTANVNPFTPDSLLKANKKRSRTQLGRENQNLSTSLPLFSNLTNQNFFNKRLLTKLSSPYSNEDDDIYEIGQAPKRLALQDTNISRYRKEFIEVSLIGVGEFGMVYQCLNRLDGCVYAVKKSRKPIAGSALEQTALNEVWAHAVLGKHDNVVRYYSAWAEDNHMLIQNEFCNGGSLQSVVQKRSLCESELLTLLRHIAKGLEYIHSNDLVHMDLKAGNIFLTKVPARPVSSLSDSYDDDGFEDLYEELKLAECLITYKIGDLGHVTSAKCPQVEEGDCRYLPKEILQENYTHLPKADIFSLGITLFEAAGGGPLPKNGVEWHNLRDGGIPDIPTLSREFNDLIKLMAHPDPNMRPSSTSIFDHPVLNSADDKTKVQLSHELSIEKQKNLILLKKLKEARKIIKSYEHSKTPLSKNKIKSNESPSITTDRRLRSYNRRQKPAKSISLTNRRSLKDRNKNVIQEINS